MGKFSGDNANLFDETDYFVKSIANLGNSTWEKVMEEATKFVPAGARQSSAAKVVTSGNWPGAAPHKKCI